MITPLASLPTPYRQLIFEQLVPFAESLGLDNMHRAWQDFWGEHPWPKALLAQCFEPLFVPWFLFHWPYPEASLAARYQQQQAFIQKACASSYRFYRAINAYTVKDVFDSTAPLLPFPYPLKVGELVFACLIDHHEPLLLAAFPEAFAASTTLDTLPDNPFSLLQQLLLSTEPA